MVVRKAATWADPSAAPRVGCWVSRWAGSMVATRVECLAGSSVVWRVVDWAVQRDADLAVQ